MNQKCIYQHILSITFVIGMILTSSAFSKEVENLLMDPGFEEPVLGWSLARRAPAAATLTIDTNDKRVGQASARIEITDVGDGSSVHNLTLDNNAGITVEANKTYTVDFWTKAEADRTLIIDALLNQDPWTRLVRVTDLPVTREWTRIHHTFQANATLSPVVFLFSFVDSKTTIWLDHVRFYEGEFDEEDGVPELAFDPDPEDGAVVEATWASLSWRPGSFAVTHDVYFGESFDAVNEGAEDTFVGNQGEAFFVVGFPGFPYPDGLVPSTTYYWRVDEVNDTEPNSPWKGDVWSLSISPKTAYFPDPTDGAESVSVDVQLSWTRGYGAKLHTVYFGESFNEVDSATGGLPQGTTTFTPGALKMAKTYYWRVDESDGIEAVKGEVWSFTTVGAVSGRNPANGAVDVDPAQILTWTAGAVAESHDVYFGTDVDAVKNATTVSPEYTGPKALGEESFDPGRLMLNTTYYWRIDEVNGVNPDSPWADNVWSFTTGDFFVIDDFEDYDAGENQIWYTWHDGLGAGALGTLGYIPGNGTGSAVGDETTGSYTEETIVHGGSQSMPIAYDNNKQGYAKYSEVEYTLADQRDWTEEGVTELSLWYRGYPASVGSFVEGPVGTFTMTASGADIWAVNGMEADELHFAYKMLTGAGSIIARVNSVENTNGWAKAGVMIRESLNPDSAHAFACITPANGVASQYRPSTGGTSGNFNQTGITAPYWVKLERSISDNFTVSHSANGTTWSPVTGATAQNIPMSSNVYIGLALTSHDAALACQAVFSNVTTTGNVTGQWAHQDIGILSNDPEPLYVAVSNSTGNPAIVVHDDPAVANINTWTEWVIPLQAFADQGINLTDVDKIAIGMGTRGNMTVPSGSGKMFFDDILLERGAN